MKRKPLILISNDDGFEAKGINALVDMLRDMAMLKITYDDAGMTSSDTVDGMIKLRRANLTEV